MNPISRDRLDDVIFEDLHQEYGAYVLRKDYPNTLRYAMKVSLLFVGLAFMAPGVYSELEAAFCRVFEVKLKEGTIVQEVILPVIPPQPMYVCDPPVISKGCIFGRLDPIPESEETAENPTLPQSQGAAMNLCDSTEDNSVIDSIYSDFHLTADTIQPKLNKKDTLQCIYPVEPMPSFPGGQAELTKYLKENTHYPKEAIEKKIEGRVFVQFIINSQGEIEDAGIIKGLCCGLDEEAVRLISQMPRWTSGKAAGRADPVRYTLPVIFKLPE